MLYIAIPGCWRSRADAIGARPGFGAGVPAHSVAGESHDVACRPAPLLASNFFELAVAAAMPVIEESASSRTAAAQREADLRINAIRRTERFTRLPAADQQALASHPVHAPFATGDVMTRERAVAHWLYLIIHGEAKVLVAGPNGSVQVAALHNGDFFGEMGMLAGEARRAAVVAVTAVDCHRLDKDGFAQVLQQRPDLAREVSVVVDARNADLGT